MTSKRKLEEVEDCSIEEPRPYKQRNTTDDIVQAQKLELISTRNNVEYNSLFLLSVNANIGLIPHLILNHPSSFFPYLSREHMKTLSLTGKRIHQISRIFIENNFYFRMKYVNSKFVKYAPKNVVVKMEVWAMPDILNETYKITSLTSIKLESEVREILDITDLPKNVTSVTLCGLFSYYDGVILPAHIINLVFTTPFFGGPIISFPPNLKSLTMSGCSKMNTKILPRSLEFLSVSTMKGLHNLDEHLPNLKSLCLRHGCDIKVRFLPKSLRYLDVGDFFNQNIDHLPANITSLKLGEMFEQSIASIPSSVKFLELASISYHHRNCLSTIPASVEYLRLHKNYTGSLSKLPTTIKCVSIGDQIISHFDKVMVIVCDYVSKWRSHIDSKQRRTFFYGLLQRIGDIKREYSIVRSTYENYLVSYSNIYDPVVSLQLKKPNEDCTLDENLTIGSLLNDNTICKRVVLYVKDFN